MSPSCFSCVPLKLLWLLKSPLDQNLIVIYHKFNSDFKSHINLGVGWYLTRVSFSVWIPWMATERMAVGVVFGFTDCYGVCVCV
jgi:hypothetical protein